MITSILVVLVAALVVGSALLLSMRLAVLLDAQRALPEFVRKVLDDADCASAADLHTGFANQLAHTRQALDGFGERIQRLSGEERDRQDAAARRLSDSLGASFETLRAAVTRELADSRKRIEEMNLTQQDALAKARQEMTETLAKTLRETSDRLAAEVQAIAKTADTRLDQISGKVEERLDEGFRKTNETFVNVMQRLACIDTAQKKIDELATNVVSLQTILGDKRSRGAFGEVQLEGLVRNALPGGSYAMQHTFSTGARADCALFLPEPTGTIAVDSKFPLESYRKMTDPACCPPDRKIAERQFAIDVKKHVDAIAEKYILAGETSDGAVMFVPAESVFAEIHDRHPELVMHAERKRVWIVSPTTLWATLNTARAVLKDVETRQQVHVIKDNLTKLGKEFERFDERMKKLADHIRLAHEDAANVHLTSKKITSTFRRIEGVQMEDVVIEAPVVPRLDG